MYLYFDIGQTISLFFLLRVLDTLAREQLCINIFGRPPGPNTTRPTPHACGQLMSSLKGKNLLLINISVFLFFSIYRGPLFWRVWCRRMQRKSHESYFPLLKWRENCHLYPPFFWKTAANFCAYHINSKCLSLTKTFFDSDDQIRRHRTYSGSKQKRTCLHCLHEIRKSLNS